MIIIFLLRHYLTSAATGDGVSALFTHMLSDALKSYAWLLLGNFSFLRKMRFYYDNIKILLSLYMSHLWLIMLHYSSLIANIFYFLELQNLHGL